MEQIKLKMSRPMDENLEPNNEKKKLKGDLWCPYCGEWRKFKTVEWGWKRCVGCTISTEDYYVKKANKMFGFSIKPSDRGGRS